MNMNMNLDTNNGKVWVGGQAVEYCIGVVLFQN